MNPEISIVVPIYQVEKYIKNCIISICNQSFKNFEIILVNDGSKDNSLKIAIDTLESNHRPYKYIEQENKGVSEARNAGIRIASGNWIVCVDSDDVITENFLKILIEQTSTNESCVSIVGYKPVNEENIFSKIDFEKESTVLKKEEIIEKFLYRKSKIIVPAMLIKKELIEKEKLFYNPLIKYSEDQEYIWRVLLSVKEIVLNPSEAYNYLQREHSTMQSSKVDKILTGYEGFKKLTNEIKNIDYVLSNKILCRWVLGALHASSKMLSYKQFLILCDTIDTNLYITELLRMQDIKIKISTQLLRLNKKLFYIVSRYH